MQGQTNIQKVKFLPWVGKNYKSKSNEFSGIRLLVLGESHYQDAPSEDNLSQDPEWMDFRKTNGDEHLTSFVVKKWGKREPARFFTVIANVLLNSRGTTNSRKRKIWNDVAFYNYVSTIVPWNPNEDRPERPTNRQWKKSKKRFRSVLKKLKPDAVLILGRELTEWVSENHKHKEYKELFVPYKHKDIIYLGIKHPSGGLSNDSANPAFQKLLKQTKF